jgi:hypothetical protein
MGFAIGSRLCDSKFTSQPPKLFLHLRKARDMRTPPAVMPDALEMAENERDYLVDENRGLKVELDRLSADRQVWRAANASLASGYDECRLSLGEIGRAWRTWRSFSQAEGGGEVKRAWNDLRSLLMKAEEDYADDPVEEPTDDIKF